MRFNDAAAAVDLTPTCDAEAARRRGRYSLESDERVDVLVARAVPTVEGVNVQFDEVWNRRQRIPLAPGIDIQLPGIDDLILTKRFANRPRDLEDVRLLTILKDERA